MQTAHEKQVKGTLPKRRGIPFYRRNEGTGLGHFAACEGIEGTGFGQESFPKEVRIHLQSLQVVVLSRLMCDCPSWGPVAQRLEQQTHNLLVVGSNPTGPTTKLKQELYLCTEMLEARIARFSIVLSWPPKCVPKYTEPRLGDQGRWFGSIEGPMSSGHAS
jgi:hypothetical protein